MNSVEWTALITAAVSVLGTLGGGMFAQRAATRDKQLDADRQDRRAAAERVAAANALELDAKRALYVELGAAARAYRAACLEGLDSKTPTEPARKHPSALLPEARGAYLAAYAQAQMTLPEFVLSVVSEINGAVALGTRLIAGLEQSASQNPQTLALARAWCDSGIGNAVWLLRAVLRWDLGIVDEHAEFDGPRAGSTEDFRALRDDLRRLRQEATAAFFPESRVPPESYEGQGHGTIFGPWPPVHWHRGSVGQDTPRAAGQPSA